MFAVFLPSLNFRGNSSPYLWWFYKFVSELGAQAAYICGEDYFLDPAEHHAAGRQDASKEVATSFGFAVPNIETLAVLAKHGIPNRVWRSLEDRFPSNPLAAFQDFCLQKNESLGAAVSESLDQITQKHGQVEAVLTCVNCITLTELCRTRDVPLIHVELGALRRPHFPLTAYFDFSGVNGGTEALARFTAAEDTLKFDGWENLKALQSLFFSTSWQEDLSPEVDLGLALQVEDDSNVICYSNGFSSSSLINDAQIRVAQGAIAPPVLVRSHPGSLFSVRNISPEFVADTSETSLQFISRCKRIHTINSSVAVEALLYGREVSVFGDSSFGFCINPLTNRINGPATAFFLLNYLVPWDIALSSDYLRFRLAMPSEERIREMHLKEFMHKKIELLEARIDVLEEQIAEMKSSLSWRITQPLRTLLKMVRQIKARVC